MKQKKGTIYRQFFLTNLSLLVLPLLFCTGYIFYLTHVAEHQKVQEIELNVERSRDLFELKQQAIQTNYVSRIILDTAITSALERSYQPNSPEMIYLVRASSRLREYVSTEKDILDLAIVSLKNNVIVSSSLALSDLSLFYKSNYYSYSDEEEWRTRYFDKTAANYFVSDLTTRYGEPLQRIVSYTQYVPSYTSGQSGYWIWIRWSEENFLKYVTYPVGAKDSFYVCNGNGEVLAVRSGGSAEDPLLSGDYIREGCWIEKRNGRSVIFAQMYSKMTGLLYCATVDHQSVMAEVYGVRVVLILLMVILVSVSLFQCYILAKKRSEPIQSIVSILGEKPRQDITYRSTMSSIEEALRTGNESLRELQEQKERLKGMMIEKFLNNGLMEEDIRAEGLLNRIFADGYCCGILCIRFTFPEQQDNTPDTTFAFVGKFLEDYLKDEAFLHYSDQYTLVLILKLPEKDPDGQMERQVQSIRMYLKNAQGIGYQISSSNAGGALQDVPMLYHQAAEGLQYAINEELEYCRYRELPQLENQQIFSAAWELKLINNVRAGNAEAVTVILNEFVSNLSNAPQIRKLQKEALAIALYRTLDSISQLSISPEVQERIQCLRDHMDKKDRNSLENILTIFRDLSLNIAKAKMNRGQLLRQKMMNLVDEHYTESQFCMQDMLEFLNISATSFQTVFKEHVGVSFYKYLEELRMRKACALLVQTSLSITEIAEKVGYSSPASFRRAFKKNYNISPVDYREAAHYQ